MEINKAHWSTEKDHIRLSMPIAKVDKERRIVSGFATLDNLDRQGDIVPAEASLKAFETFRGNIREMHQPIAVGKLVSFKEDKYFDPESKKFYNGVFVSAYVSKGAQDTWEKVLDGTLTGFSIGGSIEKADDVYDEQLDKPIRVIKEYSLSELSLVDSPANQFANVLSIEKGMDAGYLAKANIENVYWCSNDDIVQLSSNSISQCPQCDKAMQNIGFVESNDAEKASVIKSIVNVAKNNQEITENSYVRFNESYGKVTQLVTKGGVRLNNDEVVCLAKEDDPIAIINLYTQKEGTIIPTNRRVIKNISSLEKVNAISKSEVKEVSKMDSDIIVIDEEIEKSMSEEVIEPAPQDAIPVVENTEKAVEIEIEEEDDMAEDTAEEEDDMTAKADAVEDVEKSEATEEVAKSDDSVEVAKQVEEIANSLSSALSTLAETVKALDAKIEGINKSVAGISDEVKSVKENYDSFGKRVDAVEKDTAFRKSADLGEILQETPVIMEKSLWGGRFLNNADLF